MHGETSTSNTREETELVDIYARLGMLDRFGHMPKLLAEARKRNISTRDSGTNIDTLPCSSVPDTTASNWVLGWTVECEGRNQSEGKSFEEVSSSGWSPRS